MGGLDQTEVDCAHTLRWTPEVLEKKTPSRISGISEKDERTERFIACDYARNVIRTLYTAGDKNQESESTRVQILACYYVQLFFMFRSLKQEDPKVVAVGATFLACKVRAA
ncbi:unnamed protein product [Polarella glacialis]|uniref:Cyclin N-terminal domain-containing protein n=1 Tax=Polarella glacialis TaxID=89957 RepID=A0A813J9U9_POLGL|nr:unnamed protein product [Polarella glacialis]